MAAPSQVELVQVRAASTGAPQEDGDLVVHWQSSFGLVVIQARAGQVFVNGERVEPVLNGRVFGRTGHPSLPHRGDGQRVLAVQTEFDDYCGRQNEFKEERRKDDNPESGDIHRRGRHRVSAQPRASPSTRKESAATKERGEGFIKVGARVVRNGIARWFSPRSPRATPPTCVVKASTSPSPLREFNFDSEMHVIGVNRSPKTPLLLLPSPAAAAVRRRRANPAFWLQLHMGFLCEERRKETRRVNTAWQVGNQPGDWAWLRFEDAVRFMGGLEAGQGQPVILSVWAPAWRSRADDIEAFETGAPVGEHVPDTCWWVEAEALSEARRAAEPERPHATVWRLQPGRQTDDGDLRAWHVSR